MNPSGNALAAARPDTPPRLPWRLWTGVLVAVLAIKLAGVWGDPALRLFMGDSASYLHSALTGWVPPDRSFTYGWLVRHSALALRSPLALVLLQTGLGVAGCLLLMVVLHRRLGVSAAISAVAAIGLALDPSQLFYERLMMAESAGSLALMLHVVLLVTYATTGRLRWMAAAAVAGIAAVSLRFSLLPVVFGLAATVPVVASLCGPRRLAPTWALLMHLGFAALATGAVHHAYMRYYGEQFDGVPTYLQARGMMRLGLVAPLVRPEHFEGTGVPGSVLAEVKLDLADPRTREAQVWTPDGLFAALSRHSSDPEKVARKITGRALRSDPSALLGMGLGNLRDYFDQDMLEHRISDDLARRAPDDGVTSALREHLDYDYAGVAAADTWMTTWFRAGVPWMLFCLFALAPLALASLALSWRTPRRAAALVLCLASLGLFASLLLFSHIPSLRYLHPLPFFVLANLAVIADGWRRRRDQGPGVAR